MGTLFLSASIKQLFKIKTVTVDNAVFKLHYKLTALVLFGASLLVTGYQFFGNPIYCIMHDPSNGQLKRFVESFCWIESTYSLPKAWDKKVGEEIVYAGVDTYTEGDDVVEHAYYQWVCLVLFMQSCMFIIPHIVWKAWEGGKIKGLIFNLDKPISDKESRSAGFTTLAKYFGRRQNGHVLYFYKFFLCEIFNFINVVGQMYLMDKFLNGEFSSYGTQLFHFMTMEPEDRVDPMIRVFPRVSKCTYYSYGPSGNVQEFDSFCVLALNIVNEKIYVFLWLWFIILSVISALMLVVHFFAIVAPYGRYALIRSANMIVDEGALESVLSRFSIGDWFVLHLLGKSMDKFHFKEFIDVLANPPEIDGTRL